MVLDILLVIIFIMMVPIGFYRGGLRELCVSGALMLGILMAGEWADRWKGLYERIFDVGESSATFLTAITIAFGITALIGYGGSSVLSYQPGPGGRLYGAYLALFNAMVVAGFLINLYVALIVPNSETESITTGIVARTLSQDFGWVLLIATIGVGIATLFGMFVRERSPELPAWQPQTSLYQAPAQTRPYRTEDEDQKTQAGPPVRSRELTHWKDDEES
ncbi:MAG: CvpA family protein [Chloroflexi bacterium]|nr:CvpA family protein [Chloroflexota bacterium]